MKLFIWLCLMVLLTSCNSSTQLVEHWKNPDINVFKSNKILIIGMTSNLDARQQFEERLKKEYQARGIEAVMSLQLYKPLTESMKTELELETIENDLLANGFDAVLVTKVLGVEDDLNLLKTYANIQNTRKRFRDDYYFNQEIYFDPDYYETYTLYHIESSLYCICPEEDQNLIWKGYIDVPDPKSTKETIDGFIKLLIGIFEEQNLINSKNK